MAGETPSPDRITRFVESNRGTLSDSQPAPQPAMQVSACDEAIVPAMFVTVADPAPPSAGTHPLHHARVLSLLLLGLLLASAPTPAAELQADFAESTGVLRPLHGINKGPMAAGGMIDVTDALRTLSVPLVRLHDCHWPNPDVVDMHAVFPDPKADPSRPASYDFARTDEYVNATLQTGAQVVYRLGESIEHTARKRFAHPPADPARWTEACLGIIRHYNEGWADGFHHGIRYWEIWNEPENRPAMWSGTDEQYFQLYSTAARAIRQRHPGLKVGGPAVGASGQFVDGVFRPSAFVTRFLEHCRREAVPLDFFSWHCYTDDPTEPARRAHAIRKLLDSHGFTATESHLNEWNFLPGNSWSPIARTAAPEARQRYHEAMSGAPGAAFIAAALVELQDAPVDACNLFHGELGGFGLFSEHGVPRKNYQALLAFRDLLRTPQRVRVRGAGAAKAFAAAGLNAARTEASLLIADLEGSGPATDLEAIHLPWRGATIVETRQVDAQHDFGQVRRTTNAPGSIRVPLDRDGPAVTLVRLTPGPMDTARQKAD